MNHIQLKKISKRLSYVLRHRPDSIGLQLGESGWVTVAELLDALAKSGRRVSVEQLEEVVSQNDKQRFEFSPNQNQIRARQGHSVEIELGYQPEKPPDILYHGTATRNIDSIFQQGLLKAHRHQTDCTVICYPSRTFVR
jgi:putative RNA 2'-phosphotransferase